jgi:quercetin dioxygenase-like cupin family protein
MKFAVTHARDTAFEGGGLRPLFEYRDVGIRKATGGRVGAHVIRARRKLGRPLGLHRHALDFQMVYILKGWAKFLYEGEGVFVMRKGDCVHQPPGIHHDLLDCSPDLEMLEITTPARFATAKVKPKPKRAAKTPTRKKGRRR